MSPKLKQFFQDAKVVVFYRHSKKADKIYNERKTNAYIASFINLGAATGLLAASVATGSAVPASLAAIWLMGTNDRNRNFIAGKGYVPSELDDKNNPPSPKP